MRVETMNPSVSKATALGTQEGRFRRNQIHHKMTQPPNNTGSSQKGPRRAAIFLGLLCEQTFSRLQS